jgi:hypothetical protein
MKPQVLAATVDRRREQRRNEQKRGVNGATRLEWGAVPSLAPPDEATKFGI